MTDLEDINYAGMANLPMVLERTPKGIDVQVLAERLGLLARFPVQTRQPFERQISSLGAPQLSDLQSAWASEYGRVVELIGLLSGQEKILQIKMKSARSRARARVRRELAAAAPEGGRSKPTVSEINDLAEEDVAVIELEEQSELIQVLLASALAAKDATTIYLQAASREISFRCSQMDAKIY